MKKILSSVVMALALCLLVTGCGKEEVKNLSYTPSEVIEKVYEGINEDDLPKLITMDLDKDNMAYYIGVEDLDIKKGVASEPAMGSTAFSVVALTVNDGVDIEKAKKDIKENVNPAKWICVDAENVIVENNGNMILLIMMDEDFTDIANKVQENFKNLK